MDPALRPGDSGVHGPTRDAGHGRGEDNGLIEYPFIAGPGEQTPLARDLQAQYFRRHPEKTDRDWIVEAPLAVRAVGS